MRIRRSTRDQLVIAAIALVCAAASVSPVARPIRGLSLDILTALRWEVFGRRQDPAASPAVVVAMDEESLRTAPFKGSPMLTWTGEIGRVLAATLEGGAKVAGFDVVIPNSLEQSEIPFGDGMLGEKVRGFDRDFLRALAGASATGKVVLGEVLGDGQPITAVARTAHRGTPAAEYPAAQRPYRQRRRRAPAAADLYHRRRESADHGGRTGGAGARRPRPNSTSAAG